MKTAALMRALDLAKSSLGPSDSALPIVGHFCFDGSTVYAYDDVTAIVVTLESDLACGLHGETMLGMVSVMGTEDIALEDAELSVKFKVANGYMEVPKMKAKEFIFELPEHLPMIAEIPVNAAFFSALELCMAGCDEQNLNAAFAGITVDCAKDGFKLYATDNVTAILCEIEGVYELPTAKILPVRACAQLLKLGVMKGNLLISNDLALFEFDEGVLITKISNTDAASFENVFSEHFFSATLLLEEIPKGMAKEIAKAAVVLGKEREKYCTMEFSDGSMKVNAAGVLGRMETVLKTKSKTQSGTVFVVVDPILKILPHVTHFHVNDGQSIVFANPDTGLVYMVSSRPIQKVKVDPPRPGKKVKASADNFANIESDIPF